MTYLSVYWPVVLVGEVLATNRLENELPGC